MALGFLWLMATLVIWGGFSGKVVSYERPPPRETLFIPQRSLDSTYPDQVHVSIVGEDKMRISWITKEKAPSKVEYGTSSGTYDASAEGTATSYHYLMAYRSGQIHEVVIGPLKPNTVYFYRCGGDSSREFSFKTTPAQLPIKFAVAGDLGQTGWTKSTLDHISKTNYDMLLLPGDLSYADCWQKGWDSFGRLVEPLASQRPWMVTQGNHELEKVPVLHETPFTAYNARWRMPFEESKSQSNLYYSFDVAGGGAHVIMLGSYTDFSLDSSQYSWLEGDLKRLDRKRTPWVVVVIHAPWYNSNKAHQGEPECENMRNVMEKLVYDYRVDVVFAGHVHAYERFTRVYDGKLDNCGPVHITIGDGGNREGLSSSFMDSPPEISIFREASFGHGSLEIVNTTHARWEWHRNDDDEPVVTDSIWLTSLASNPACKPH